MMLYAFIRGLTGRVFKMLPLREDADNGLDVYLEEYMQSLARDVIGSMVTFPELVNYPEYVTIVNTIQYLATTPTEFQIFRKEVFHMLEILNNVDAKLRLGGDVDVGHRISRLRVLRFEYPRERRCRS